MAIIKPVSKYTSKSIFSSVWEDIKKPIIIGFPLIVLYKAISTIQILGLILEIAMRYFIHTTGEWDFIYITRTFNFYQRFDFHSYNSVTAAAYVICWLILILNYLLIIIVFLSKKLPFRSLQIFSTILQHYMIFHQFVFFLPIHTFCLEVIDSSSMNRFYLFGNADNTVFFIFSIFAIVLNILLGLLNLRCYSSLYAQKAYAKRNSYLSFTDMAFKTFLAVYIIFVPVTTYGKWTIICITLVYTALSYYFFHSQLPFFQIKVIESYCFFLGAKIALGLAIFIIGIFDQFRVIAVPDLPIAAFIITLPICVKGQFHMMEKTIIKAITLEEKNYKTEDDVFIHLLAIRYMFKKGATTSIKSSRTESTNWNMQLNGVVIRHSNKCMKVNCGCRIFLEIDEVFKTTGIRKEKYKELEVTLMMGLYEKGVEKIHHSELMLLNQAQFYLLYKENYLKSYLVLQAFEKKMKKSFETEILVDYLKKRIQERMQLKLSGNGLSEVKGEFETNNLNVTEVVQNEIQFIQLKKLMQEQLTKQLKFWDLLDNFELNAGAIANCCEEINFVRNKIEKLWENLSRINQKCSSHYLLYGLYQTLINNTTKAGERYLNDYNRMREIDDQEKEGLTNNNIYDMLTIIIRISMRRDKIGIIENCSGDVDSLFGYKISELVDTNVATLMSSFFKERHHTFVMNHFDKGTENVLNRVKRLFGYHKEGHIFPIFLYVSIYPNLETGLSYMGIIRPRKVYNNYILMKGDGSIDSYSPEIGDYLGLESRKKYNIMEICPQFEKINNAFNYLTRTKHENLKDDFVEYKQESNSAKYNDKYFVKVINTDSQKAIVESSLSLKKKDFGTLATEMDDSNRAMGIGSIEAKDEGSGGNIKPKDVGMRSVAKLKTPYKKLRRLNTEDIDEYKKVYDQFSINGSVLSFLPQRDRKDAPPRNFLCTVSDDIVDYSILRIITLGKNDENAENENIEAQDSDRHKNNATDVMYKEVLLTTEQEDMGISLLPNFKEQQLFRNPFESDSLPEKQSFLPRESLTPEMLIKGHLEAPDNSMFASSTKNEFADSRINQTSMRKGSIRNSNDTEGTEQELRAEFFDSRDFIQEMFHNDALAEKGEISGSSLQAKGGVISKLEALFYKKEEGKTSNRLKSYFVILLAYLVVAVTHSVIIVNSLEEGSVKTQKILTVGQRTNELLRMNYDCRILDLYLNGYITKTRHLDDLRIINYPAYALNDLKSSAERLLVLNTEVMNDIYDLDELSQQKFFSSVVDLKYPSDGMEKYNVKELNIFEAVGSLGLSALEISSQTTSTISTRQEDIKYILLNSMNQLFVSLQNGIGIYEDDFERTLSQTMSIVWGISAGAISIYLLFLIILVRDLAAIGQDKTRFWNSLIKLDMAKSSGHKKMLLIIKENLENNSNYGVLRKSLVETKRQEIKELKMNKNKEAQANGFKRLKTYRLSSRSYLTVFPFLVVLCVILFFFIASAMWAAAQIDVKRLYMREIKQSEIYYALNLVTLNGIYEYISEGGTTNLEGAPIQNTLEINLALLSMQAVFVSYFESRNIFDPKAFIQANICDIYTDEDQKDTCLKDGKGINTQGLLSVLTTAKETMSSVMDFAKQSDRSVDSKRNALKKSDLLLLELELRYISDMFDILSAKLAESESSEQEEFKTQKIIITLVFVLLMALINTFIVSKMFKSLDGRKYDNIRILRLVPMFMILESKMLKTYLLKSYKDDLSSITNKL